MKKLNRKGFTLVELLAVIIILAIVVGITIPAVLTTTSKAKTKAFKTAAQTAADWIDRQYQVMSTGLSDTEIATLDSNFSTVYGNNCTVNSVTKSCMLLSGITVLSSGTANTGQTVNPGFIKAAGLTTDNVASIKVTISESTGRSCVTLTAAAGGDYKGAGTGGGDTMNGGSCA